MAQADGVVANGTGSAVRADINGQLAALFTNHSGSTEPSTTFAFQTWADTNTNTLKLRNSSNDGWVQLARLDGQFDAKTFNSNITLNAQSDLRFADSDSSNWVAFQAPATVASNVTWTLPSADGTADQALTTNGSGVLSWADAGGVQDNITEGNTSAEVVDTGSDGHFKVVTEGTEALRVNASQQVGIGTSNPQADLHIGSGTATGVEIDNTGTLQVIDRGNSRIEPLTVTAEYAAFSIARNASTTLHDERARFTYDGLTFNGDTAATNALDDYEEGTWTPNIGGTATYDIQWGYYVKVGAMVHCWGGLRPSSMGTGDNKAIKGLPFTALNSPSSTQTGGGMITWHDNAPQSFTNTPALAIIPNTTNVVINGKDAASGVLQDNRNFWQNNHRANFFLTYRVTL